MSSGLLIIIAGAYLWVAADYYQQGRWGMALAFLAYAISNIGFAIDLRRAG